MWVLVGLLGSCWSMAPVVAQQLPGGFGGGAGGFGGSGGFGGQRPGSSTTGFAGIDDSTRVIYGPTTTRYFYEPDLFNNRKKLYTLDTLMDGVHRYNFVQRNQNLLQDLGNLGTALRQVFYEEPDQIGALTGFTAYQPYAYQTQQVKYYDTRSPFTNMYLVLGGAEQNVLNFDFSQNVNPRWNLGFNSQRFTSNKQFGTSGSTDLTKQLAADWGFLAHSNYRSKDDKYVLLVHFNHQNHTSGDQGGKLPGRIVNPNNSADITLDPYDLQAPARLPNLTGTSIQANTRQVHNELHLYQEYVPVKGFQVFHRLDVRRHLNTFVDDSLRLSRDVATSNNQTPFYANYLYDSSRTHQDVYYWLVENMGGLKGIYQLGRSAFNYRAYIRNRVYNQNGQYNAGRGRPDGQYTNKGIENFFGLWVGYYFPDSLSRLTGEVEFDPLTQNLRLEGQLQSRLLTAGYRSIFASPTLVQQRFVSNQFRWDNTSAFGLRGTQHLYGTLNLRYRGIVLRPGADYHLLTNYTYFDTDAIARQASGVISILRLGLGYGLRLGKLDITGQGYYTVVSRSDILRVPTLFVNTRIQYDFLFAKVLHGQAGVDLHYKSSYYADAYMPVHEQFYLQNRQQVEGTVIADVFVNLRINRVRLFVKLAYANQGLGKPNNFVAPDFLSIGRTFGFGVNWYLFD